MKTYEFSLILAEEPDEAQADTLYSILTDGTLTTTSGVAQISFHREADSLEAAIRSALADVSKAGLSTLRVEFEPAMVSSLPG